MSEQKKKKWGDRSDAVWLKDLPSMNRIMPCIMPNRADNEAFISVDIDYKPLEAYLAKKNEGLTEDKYTFFHVIACAIGKAFVLHDEPVCLQQPAVPAQRHHRGLYREEEV